MTCGCYRNSSDPSEYLFIDIFAELCVIAFLRLPLLMLELDLENFLVISVFKQFEKTDVMPEGGTFSPQYMYYAIYYCALNLFVFIII